MSEQPKRLYRSRTNRVLAGVCGGFAEYLNLDPTLIRLLWIFLTMFGGSGILLYVISYFLMPLNPHQTASMPSSDASLQVVRIIGVILVFVGLIALMDNLEWFHFRHWMRVSWEYLVPAMLIAAGVYMLTRRRGDAPLTSGPGGGSGSEQNADQQNQSRAQNQSFTGRRLERSMVDRKFLGVCGGLGIYFGIDPTLVRILFVIFTLMSFGFGIVLYFVMFLIMPEERLIPS